MRNSYHENESNKLQDIDGIGEQIGAKIVLLIADRNQCEGGLMELYRMRYNLNNGDILDYYKQIRCMYSSFAYYRIYRKSKESLDKWENYGKYSSLSRPELCVSTAEDLQSYFTQSWQTVINILSHKIIRSDKIPSSREDSIGDIPESDIVDRACQLGLVSTETKKQILNEVGQKGRHKYAHEEDIARLLYKERTDDILDQMDNINKLIEDLFQSVFEVRLSPAYSCFSPFDEYVNKNIRFTSLRSTQYMTAMDLHSHVRTPEVIDKYFNILNFLGNVDYSTQGIENEIENRGYSISELEETPVPSLIDYEDFSTEYNINNVDQSDYGTVILDISYPKISKSKDDQIEIYIDTEDIFEKDKRIDKCLEVRSYVRVNSISHSEADKDLDEKDVVSLEIGLDNPNKLIVDVSICISVLYNNKVEVEEREIRYIDGDSLNKSIEKYISRGEYLLGDSDSPLDYLDIPQKSQDKKLKKFLKRTSNFFSKIDSVLNIETEFDNISHTKDGKFESAVEKRINRLNDLRIALDEF